MLYDITIPRGATVIPVDFPLQKPHIMLKGIEYKHCAHCDSWHTLDSFWSNTSHKDGLQVHCKECTKELNNLWRKK